MSDGSDGAGGVGGSSGNNGSSGADAGNAGASSTDSMGDVASSVSDAVGEVADALSSAISSALGTLGDVAGLSSALGQIGDMLGIDAKDLQGLLGVALMGAISGGVPGAIAAVAQSLIGGTLTDAAKDAVSANMPSQFQDIANLAIDTFAKGIPGAVNASNMPGVLGTLASGALTNGRAPSASDIGEVARAMTGLSDVARGVLGSVASGNFAGAVDAASALDGNLRSAFEQGRQVSQQVAASFGESGGVYANGGHGAFGDAAEQLAVSTARLIGNR